MANVRINYIVDKSQVEAAESSLKDLNRAEGITEKSTKDLANKFREANTDAAKMKRGVNDASGELSKFNRIAKAGAGIIGGFFAIQQLVTFGKSIVDTTGKFQTFEAVLTNTLGSNSRAKKALNDLSAFAAKTPFAIDQLTSSFVKLANQGFTPTTNELRKLGDLASSTGKDFDMLTEALIDAQVGEFERLKEFGIRASKEGDQVRFTFKGVETQTDFTNKAIRNYILSLGDLEGVSGSMAAISETVTGKVSNLGDNITQLEKNIGDANSGLIAGVLDLANNALSAVNEEMTKSGRLADALEEKGVFKPGFWDRLKMASANFFSAEKPQWLREYEEAAALASAEIEELDKMTASFQTTIKGLSEEQQLAVINETLRSFKGNPKFIEYLQDLKTELIAGANDVQGLAAKWDELTEAQQKNFISTGEANLSIREAEMALADFRMEMEKLLEASDTMEDEAAILKRFEQEKKAADEAKKAAIEISNILGEIESVGEAGLQDYYDTATKLNEEFTADYKEKSEQRKKTDEEEDENRRRIIDESISLALSAADSITSIQQNRIQKEINDLQEQKQFELGLEGRTQEQRASIQERFDAQITELRRRQALKERNLALFNIAIDTAVAVTRAIKAAPVTFGLPFSAFALAQGGLQAGVVASTPLPFNKGTKRVPGVGNTDTVPAILTPGEGVMPVHRMNAYRPAFEAMFDGKIKPEVLNSFVKNGGSQVIVNNDMSKVAQAIKGQPKTFIKMDRNGWEMNMVNTSQKLTKKINRYT